MTRSFASLLFTIARRIRVFLVRHACPAVDGEPIHQLAEIPPLAMVMRSCRATSGSLRRFLLIVLSLFAFTHTGAIGSFTPRFLESRRERSAIEECSQDRELPDVGGLPTLAACLRYSVEVI